MESKFEEKITYENVIGRQRNKFTFDNSEISRLSGERILVTGAGGSIGSRIVSQLNEIPGLTVLATDRDESALHSLSLQLSASALFESNDFALMDIRDLVGVRAMIESFEPTLVIHAAALKHLSVLERQPREATLTNVLGTVNVIDECINAGVKSFVNISTDKAARPKSVLGLSKHLGEIYTAYVRRKHSISYTSCRFGNVFNSRGSVIETFSRQMITGAPITLTDIEVNRYFMHTDDAAFLSIQTHLLSSSDVHVFNMGDPIKLIDVAIKMKDLLKSSSEIVITGLRIGEKMSEDLIEPDAILNSTHLSEILALDFSAHYLEKRMNLVEMIVEGSQENITNYLSNTMRNLN
jgi:FlaA1/EpsC-like NDP-sugar epimerase